VGRKRPMCPFTRKEKWENLFLISIGCCFESLRRRKNKLVKNKRETRRKTSRGSEKN
jgi:hypothetical protein